MNPKYMYVKYVNHFLNNQKKTQLNTKTGRSKLKRYDFILWPSNNCGHFVFVLNL